MGFIASDQNLNGLDNKVLENIEFLQVFQNCGDRTFIHVLVYVVVHVSSHVL